MSAPEITIDFDCAGTGHCLYDESINLSAIGSLRMRRASHIEFNETTQHWVVLPPDGGPPLFSHPSRSRCLDWERVHLHPSR